MLTTRSRQTRGMHTPSAMAGGLLVALCALAGCAAGPSATTPGDGTGNGVPAPSPTATSTQSGNAPLVVAEAWAMAKPQLGDMPMTAVFAQIVNRSNNPVTIVSATTTASDKTELHQSVTVDGKPQMKQVSAFTLNPGVAEVLRPGADHIMVMDMKKPLAPGDTVTVTLKTADGKTKTFTAMAKTFAGGNEPYAGDSPTAGASASATHSHS